MNDQQVISKALDILAVSLTKGELLNNSKDVKSFCQLRLAPKEHEVFAVMFLDSQLRMIAFEEMFRGTINSAAVYPREVAKRALELNAAEVIFSHNHPSGVPTPSQADIQLTDTLRKALALFDINVVDHIVVSKTGVTSMTESGL